MWQAEIIQRTRGGLPTGCPFCSGLRVCKCSSLAAKRPDLMAQWDYAGNGDLDPEQIGLSSVIKVFWLCPGHGPWKARVGSRSHGRGCPGCGEINRRKNMSRRKLFKAEDPDLVTQLHPTKNKHLDLNRLTSGSGKEAVWVCPDRKGAPPGCTHPHEWRASIKMRVGRNGKIGNGCPFCSGLQVCPCCTSLAAKAPEVAA